MGTDNENAQFGGQALPRTSYDVKIDKESNKPGQQAFEKVCLFYSESRKHVTDSMDALLR